MRVGVKARRPRQSAAVKENREWSDKDFARAKSAYEVLPAAVLDGLPKRRPGERGPQKAPTKELISIRLDPDVVTHFRSTGAGWHGRINAFLRLGVLENMVPRAPVKMSAIARRTKSASTRSRAKKAKSA
jgi:uncharacterized protein (DUF4415 family)